MHLIERLGCRGKRINERCPLSLTEHRLQRALKGHDLCVKVTGGDQVDKEVLHVVERGWVAERASQREDLLAEEEALFVIKAGHRCILPRRAAQPRTKTRARRPPLMGRCRGRSSRRQHASRRGGRHLCAGGSSAPVPCRRPHGMRAPSSSPGEG